MWGTLHSLLCVRMASATCTDLLCALPCGAGEGGCLTGIPSLSLPPSYKTHPADSPHLLGLRCADGVSSCPPVSWPHYSPLPQDISLRENILVEQKKKSLFWDIPFFFFQEEYFLFLCFSFSFLLANMLHGLGPFSQDFALEILKEGLALHAFVFKSALPRMAGLHSE